MARLTASSGRIWEAETGSVRDQHDWAAVH